MAISAGQMVISPSLLAPAKPTAAPSTTATTVGTPGAVNARSAHAGSAEKLGHPFRLGKLQDIPEVLFLEVDVFHPGPPCPAKLPPTVKRAA